MITNKNEAEVLREILKHYPEGIGHNELFRKTGLHKETISKIRKMLEKEGLIKYEKQDRRGKNSMYKLISKVVAEDAILNFTTKSIIANGKPQRIKMPFPDLISDIFPRKNKDDNKLGSYNYKLTDVENIVGIDFSDSASLDDFMPREIHIPKGKPVLLKIRARDVIHSVYLPYFRAQMNAVPGMPTQLWFIPTKTTQEMREEMGNDNFNYEIICNKICGRAHFSMKQNLIVEEEWEYIKWKKSQDSWIKKNPDYFANFLKNNANDLAVLNNDYESN